MTTLGSGPKDLSRFEVWHHIADTPVTFSTCASLCGRLLAVGGRDSDGKETTAIHMYNTKTNSYSTHTMQIECETVYCHNY